ncbi:hypothetical protein [Streptomyces reticuliscabiei]|uniref:hypothetical protein n=1 Tax=Streptomyces reticuliscabiei TaxID=146821 RepID=UPI000A376236|nr:hypothetical protein [Streptomyces reticuliscabiei]
MAVGAEGIFNTPGHRLANGDRVNVTVVPVPPGGRASLKADSELDLVQRIGDRLGLRDRLPESTDNRDQENAPLPDSVRTVGTSPGGIDDVGDTGDIDAPSRIATESRPTTTSGATADTASQGSRSSQGADPPAPVRVTATSQASSEVSAGGSPTVPAPETDDADADADADAVQTSAVDKGKGRAVPAEPADDQASAESPARSPDAYRRQLAGYDADQVLADYGSALTALGRAQADFEAVESARASGEGTSHGREWAEAQGRMHDAESRVTDVINHMTVLEVDAPSSEVDEADLIRRPRLRGGVLGFGRSRPPQDLLASPGGPSLVYPPRRNVVHKAFRWMKPNRAETDRLARVAVAINTGGPVPGIRMNEAGTTFKADWDPVTFGNLDTLTRMTLRNEIRDPINEAHPEMQMLDSAAWWKAVGQLDHRTAGFWRGQEARTRALEAEITRQLDNRTPSLTPTELAAVDTALQAAPDALTGATTLLNTHPGLILGETHGASTSWPFLINNMAALQAQGVGTIYVEALRGDSFQPSLNAYFQAPVNTPMPVELRRMATLYDSSHNSQAGLGLLATLEAARANGVRVVAMDGLPAASTMTSGWGSYERAVKFNAYAALTVQRDRVGRNDGYIAVIGKAHSDWHLPPTTPHPADGPVLPAHYPGLSQLLHLPSVQLDAQSTALDRILPTAVLPPGVYDPTIDDDTLPTSTPTPMSTSGSASTSASVTASASASASAGWDAARAEAVPVERSHTWVDPVSRARAADGSPTQYVVRSGFDVRRFTHDGDPVTDLTVEVEFTNADAVPEADRQAVWDRMAAGVERVFNAPGHRLPNGDRVHVTVVPVSPGGQAHLKVELAAPTDGRAMSHHVWRTDGSDQDFVHEIGHQLGLRDEYRDASSPQRPRVEGSLMGDYGLPVPASVRTEAASTDSEQHYTHGGLRPRHLALINALIGDASPAPRAESAAGPAHGAEPLAPARTSMSMSMSTSVPEHTLWDQLLDATADQQPALLNAIGDSRGGAAPSDDEVALRGRVRDGLRNLPGVTVAVEDAANFGHQAAATMMIESLAELGYEGRITVIAPDNVRQRLVSLLSPTASARVDWVPDTFTTTGTYDAGSRDRNGHLVLVAANDALVDDAELAASFLDFTGSDQAVVLRPYAWTGGHRYLYTRADADADATVTDLEEGEGGISPSALYRFEVAPVTGAALDELIGAAHLPPQREAGLTAVAHAVDGETMELMPAYGLHNLHPSQRASTLAALAEGVHAAELGRPAVVLALGNATVDFAPRHQAPWLTQVRLDDPTLPELIAAAGPGEVIVVEAGNLSQDLFRQVYGMGTLPAVVEGANTTNTLQVQGRPYFSVRTNNTPYDLLGHRAETAPPHIGEAVETLEGVTAALTAESDWGARLGDTPAWLAAGRAETAFQVLRGLHSEADDSGEVKLWLGIDEMERLQEAFGLEVDTIVADALGPDRPDQGTIDALLAPPLLGEQQFEKILRLQDEWLALSPDDRDALLAAAEDLHRRRLEALREQSAQYSVAPTPEHVTAIASAITEAAQADTQLGSYFAQLTQQARHPANDQVLQALGRVFPATERASSVPPVPPVPPAVSTSSVNAAPAPPGVAPASVSAAVQAREGRLSGSRDAGRNARQAPVATAAPPVPPDVGADPLAPAGGAESALRLRVRDGLADLPGVTVVVDIAANFGHQAAATMMIDSLTELGYEGRVTVIAPDNVRERLDVLLSAPMRARIDWVTDTFDPTRPYDANTRPRDGHLVLVAANDALVDDAELAANFLHFTGGDQAVVLRPYAWNGGHRYLYTRTGPDADTQVTDLQGTDGIPDSALYRFPVPHVTGAALDEMIDAQASTPARAAGLRAVAHAVDVERVNLMPAYGMHNLHPSERASALGALAEGIHGARLDRGAVLLALGNATVDIAPRHQAPWLTQLTLDDPDLPGRIAAAGPGEVIVVEAGNLTQDLFRQVYQMGTLPAVVEGANTSNMLQVQGRAYFSVRTNNTPYDPLDGTSDDAAAVDALQQVTGAIVARSEWGEEFENLPAGLMAGRAETARSVLGALPSETTDGEVTLYLGYNELVRLRAVFGDETRAIVVGVLGEDHGAMATIDTMLAPAPTGMPDYKWSMQLQEQWAELTPADRDGLLAVVTGIHERQLADLRAESAALSVAPPPQQVAVIAQAITDAARPESQLGRYFRRLTDQALRPDNDQVLQALGRVFATDTAHGADPLAPTAGPEHAETPVPVPPTPPGWDAARAAASPEKRSHTWVDPVSRPRGADGRLTQYVVRSGFDVRRFTHDGEPVTDLTVHVQFTNADSVPEADRQAVWDRMAAGVERVFNAPGHRLPNGDRVHVTVTPVPPGGHAHLKVRLATSDSGARTSHHTWRLDGTSQDLVHELGHQLGLRDESPDATAPQRPRVEGSLMGDYALPVPKSVSTEAVSADAGQHYAHGGLRPRHLALINALIGDPDPGPVAASGPRPGPVLGADPLAPAPPSPFVRDYGSRHDGNVGLVQVEPLPARVVDGVHQQVLRALGFGAPVAEGHPVLAQLRDRLGAEQLVLALPYLRSSMGHRVTVTVDGRERTVDVRLGLRDPAPSPRYGVHDVTDPDVRVERRGFGAQESGDSESSGNFRTVPVPWSVSVPVAAAGALRAWEISPSLSLTHNQLSLSTTVTQLVQTTTAQRSNELSQAYEFTSDWEVRIDSPRMAPPVTWSPPRAHGPVTVWFPQHLAVTDTSGTPLPPAAGLDDLPVWGVDSVADPQQLLESVLSAFHDELAALSPSSAQELEAFLAEPVLRGTLPMQRSGGIFSPLLLDSRGRAIGMFKVTTEITTGTPTHRSLDTKINLESHLVQSVKVDGQARITNAVGVDIGVGPAFTGDHAKKHPDASKKVAGSLVGKGGVRWQTSDTLGNGGTATVQHGLRTNRSHLLTPATVRHTVTLVRPGGGATPRVFGPWDDGMRLRLLTRESAEGHRPTPEERRALPAELENLESIGITAAPLTVEGPQDLFGHAEIWLRANGFLPPETNARNLVLPDESLVQAQLNNLRRFEQARSDLGLRAATDAMVDGGHPLWLERPTTTGTHRIKLNLTAVRDPGTNPLPSVHTRTLPDIQHVSLASFGMAGTEQQASGYGWSLGVGGGPSGPVGPYTEGPRGLTVPYTKGSGTLGGAADYSYSRQTGHTATVGAGLAHDQLFIGSGQGSEVFEIPARFALDLYDGPGAEPAVRFAEQTVPTTSAPPGLPAPGTALGDLELHLLEEGRPSGPPPRTVSGTITLAVPHHRTLEPASEAASPAPAPTVSRPVDADHSRLAMTAPDGSPLPGIVKLPDDAIVDVFRGSGVLQETLRQIIEGTHPGHPEAGRLGSMATAVGAASPQLLARAARSVAVGLAGQSAGDPTTVAAEVRQASLSPGNLVARAHQIFKGGYVVEGITLPGLGADQEYALEIRGVLHTARHLHSAKQYLETGVAAIDSAAQQKSVSGTHQTGLAVTGTRTPATAPAAPAASAPSGTGTASTPAPPTVFGPSGKYAYTSRTEDSGTVSSGTSVNRTATESGMEHRVGADATILITVRRGTRNVVGNTFGYGSESDVTLAVDLPEAVQFLMTDGQLSRHEKWFTGIEGLTPPPPAPAELPLPQRFTRTGEPGMAAVLSVTQFDEVGPVPAAEPDGAGSDTGGPTTGATGATGAGPADEAPEAAEEAPLAATAQPTLAERRDRLRAELTALVEAEAPGVTQPGHSSYLPGVASRIADYTSTAGLRALPGRGPRGVQRFHFRHLALGGARLVEVTLAARPRADANELRAVRGRNAGPGTGLEQYHGHTPAGVSTGTTSTTQHGLTLNPTTRYPRPGQDTRTDRSGPGLSVGSTKSQGTKAATTAEDRFWLRTDSAADFDLDYEFRASVRSELVADWPPNLVGGALQGGVLAWYDTDEAAATESWISRALSARPYRTATVPASVTLRFTGGEAAPAEVVAAPLTPTVGTTAPEPRGARFVPMGPAPVFEFNAWSELTTALDAVAPGQDRGWRSPSTSTSAESTAVRIGELIQAGDIALDHPRTATGLTDTLPGTFPFESAPGSPPSLSVTLHNPRRVTLSADVALDRVRIASNTGGSSQSGGTTGGLNFQGVYSTDDPDRVLGGFSMPVLARQPQVVGSSGGTTGGVREWLKTGSTSAPADGTHGTRTYEALVDTYLTVRGPAGVRHVSGTATVRIGERDALGHGITPPRTQPQVYDLPAMVRAAADAEAAATPDPDTQGGARAVAAPDLRDWTRHQLRTLPGIVASQIDAADPAAQLWLAIGDIGTAAGQQQLGRALFAVSRAAASVHKPVELVLRADDSTLTFWHFDSDGVLSGLGEAGTTAWRQFEDGATALTRAAAAEQEARQEESRLQGANSEHQGELRRAAEEVVHAGEALTAARSIAETAEQAVTAARAAREQAERNSARLQHEVEEQGRLVGDQSKLVAALGTKISAAELLVQKANSLVTSSDSNRTADDGNERPDETQAPEAHPKLDRLQADWDAQQAALTRIEGELRTAQKTAEELATRVLPGLRAAEKSAELAAGPLRAALTEATDHLRSAELARATALQHADHLAGLIQAAMDHQRTQAKIQAAQENALPAFATQVAARAAPPVDVPTGSLASTPSRWPDLTAHAVPAPGLPPAEAAPHEAEHAAPGVTPTTPRLTRPAPPAAATRDASGTDDVAPTDDGSGRAPSDGSFGAALLAAVPVHVLPGTGGPQPLAGVDSTGALHDWARGRLMEPGPLGLPPGVRLPADDDTLTEAEIRSLGVEVTAGMTAEAIMLGRPLTVAAVSLDPGQQLQLILNRPESGDYVATVAALAAQALGRDIVIVGPGPVEHRYGSVPGEPIRITFDGTGYSTPAHHQPES